MKITNAAIAQVFIPALRELSALKTSSKVAYNTARTIKSASAVIETFDSTRKQLLESAASKNEDGTPVIDKEKNEYVFVSDEEKSACLKSLVDLGNIEVDLDIYPVRLDDLSSTQITGQMVLSLGEFITEN
jgi:hypothetical protein